MYRLHIAQEQEKDVIIIQASKQVSEVKDALLTMQEVKAEIKGKTLTSQAKDAHTIQTDSNPWRLKKKHPRRQKNKSISQL